MSSPLAPANGYIHISTCMFFALEGPFILLAPVNGFLPPGHNSLIALVAHGALCTIRIYVLLRQAPSGINSKLPTSRRAVSSSACKLCGYIYPPCPRGQNFRKAFGPAGPSVLHEYPPKLGLAPSGIYMEHNTDSVWYDCG